MEISRETKQELRKKILERRKAVTREEKEVWDAALCAWCLQFMEMDGVLISEKLTSANTSAACGGRMEGTNFQTKPAVYLYMDVRNEAGTRRILEALWRRQAAVALPRVEGDRIHFYTVTGYGDISPGTMGIPEPSGQCCRAEDENALVIVPGVAFDAAGRRLGYGGGYYDRFFAREPKHPRWGLAYGFQIVDRLLQEEWDQRVERVITPDGWLRERA